MDFDIRKFLPSRRVRPRPSTADIDPYPNSRGNVLASPRTLVSPHHIFGRSRPESRFDDIGSTLVSFSYNSTTAGKPPVFGERPVKGNGPVKLQTGHRLSSGDILVTNQDNQSTLADIRQGEYVVAGGSSKVPDGRSPNMASQSGPSRIGLQQPNMRFTSSPLSNGFIPSPGQPSFVSGATTPVHDIHHTPPSFQAEFRPSSRSVPAPFAFDGLGISQRPSMDANGVKSSNVSLLEPHEEQNATIRALWKAEYGRLVSLYGQAGVDRNIVELNRDSTIHRDNSSPVTLPILPKPSLDLRNGGNSTRVSSRASHADGLNHDDVSDESSQGRSLMSAAGRSSSQTTRTSFQETDMVTTREDLRKIVEDMRSTYLRAIENSGPPNQNKRTATNKKKKKRRKSATSGTTPVGNTPVMTTENDQSDAQSVHSAPSPNIPSRRSTRVNMSPAAGILKNHSSDNISIKSERERERELGLKRADSTTLGIMMGETKVPAIPQIPSPAIPNYSAKTASNSPRLQQEPTYQTSYSIQAPLSGNKASPKEDLESLYNDLFGTSTKGFWQTGVIDEPHNGLLPTQPTYPPRHASTNVDRGYNSSHGYPMVI